MERSETPLFNASEAIEKQDQFLRDLKESAILPIGLVLLKKRTDFEAVNSLEPYDIYKMLIKDNAALDAIDSHGRTALFYVIRNACFLTSEADETLFKTVETLLGAGPILIRRILIMRLRYTI